MLYLIQSNLTAPLNKLTFEVERVHQHQTCEGGQTPLAQQVLDLVLRLLGHPRVDSGPCSLYVSLKVRGLGL